MDGILPGGYKIHVAYLSTVNVTNIGLWVTDNRWIWIFQNLPLLGFCNSIEAVFTYLALNSPANIILYSTEHYSKKDLSFIYKYVERNHYEKF